MSSNVSSVLRFKKTLDFMEKHVGRDETILDLGTENHLSRLMRQKGYNVTNTQGEDFDEHFKEVISRYPASCYSSFEVFEHLLAPYNILKEIEQGKLICSVPLNVWFAKAYWDNTNEWDRHYHEFEPRQFNWLLEKAGWKIIATEKWASPDKLKFGIRPLLRFFFPSYYFVYAVKNMDNQ